MRRAVHPPLDSIRSLFASRCFLGHWGPRRCCFCCRCCSVLWTLPNHNLLSLSLYHSRSPLSSCFLSLAFSLLVIRSSLAPSFAPAPLLLPVCCLSARFTFPPLNILCIIIIVLLILVFFPFFLLLAIDRIGLFLAPLLLFISCLRLCLFYLTATIPHVQPAEMHHHSPQGLLPGTVRLQLVGYCKD